MRTFHESERGVGMPQAIGGAGDFDEPYSRPDPFKMSRIRFEKSVLDDFPSSVENTAASGPVALLISLIRSKYVATLSGATSSRYLFLPRTLRQQNRRPCLSTRTSTFASADSEPRSCAYPC